MESIALFDQVVMLMTDTSHPLLNSSAPFFQHLAAIDFFTDDDEPTQWVEARPSPQNFPLEKEYTKSLESSDPVACDISLVSSACPVRNVAVEGAVESGSAIHLTGKRKRSPSEFESSGGRVEEEREKSLTRPTLKCARAEEWGATGEISGMVTDMAE